MGELYRLPLRDGGEVCEIVVGRGALDGAAPELSEWCAGRRVFMIGAEPVLDRWGDEVASRFVSGASVETVVVPDGEEAKSVAVVESVWNELLERGGKRDSRVVTVGGGSVGDLGGFAAATFLRGVEHVQIPTTLLAQVDASIGGKTGIDLRGGKNTVGSFCHPRMVVADTNVLSTLPPGEIRSGLVEVIKMAVLLDPAVLERVAGSLDALLVGDPDSLAPIVADAVRMKIEIVESDPEEGDRRRLLNYGHTLGHAIEATLGYRDLRHGEAVAYGMLFALRLGARRNLGNDVEAALRPLLARLEVPRLPTSLDPEALVEAMRRDKKATEAGVTWVLAGGLGDGRLDDSIGFDEVRRELDSFLAAPWAPAAT